jgi:hypothetical protein
VCAIALAIFMPLQIDLLENPAIENVVVLLVVLEEVKKTWLSTIDLRLCALDFHMYIFPPGY